MSLSPSPVSSAISSASPSSLPSSPAPEPRPRGLTRALGAFALGCLGVGTVGGVCWRAIVRIPAYRLDASSHALISERGLAAIFSMDAWYACVGLVSGVVIGLAAWVFFRRRGWPCVVTATLGALLAALVCAVIGWALGPGPLQGRLAAANPGDLIPVDFQVHAYSTVAVWPFGAMAPLLLLAALSRDPEDRRSRGRAGAESASDRGDGGAE